MGESKRKILLSRTLYGIVAFALIIGFYQPKKQFININYSLYIEPLKDIKVYETKCNITGYNPIKAQCDDTPNITASNKVVRLGMVAISKDLEKKYFLHFGDYVFIKGYGLFEIQDRLNSRIKNTLDIICWNKRTAYKLTAHERIVQFIKVKR